MGFRERKSIGILILEIGSQSPILFSQRTRKEGWGTPDREGHEFHSCRHGRIFDAALAPEFGFRCREPQRLKPVRIVALSGTTEVVPFPILLAIGPVAQNRDWEGHE